MNLLLDTHLVLWWMTGEVSRIGKLGAPDDLLSQLEQAGVELLPITPRHPNLAATLPLHHRDPFGRLLVAQATLEGLPLVSDDESLRRYDIEVIW